MSAQFQPIAPRPSPVRETGPLAWARRNLFADWRSTTTTLFIVGLLVWLLPGLWRWMVIGARSEALIRIYRRLGFAPGQFPAAEAYYAQALSLPMFPTLTDAQQDEVVAALRGPLLAALALPLRVVAIGAVFTLARFSEAFLLLRAQQGGLALTLVPLVLVTMNAVYAASAYPFGHLADRIDRRRLLAAGLAVLIAADLVLASGSNAAVVAVGVALWGLHMGMTQGLLAAMVADSAPADAIGTAYGAFNFACGVALLFASASAGWIWDRYGAEFTFLAAAGWALIACIALAGLGEARVEETQA